MSAYAFSWHFILLVVESAKRGTNANRKHPTAVKFIVVLGVKNACQGE
jgi:hypothetical protein